MKRISRSKLRGKPLDPMCKKAHTTTNEYGVNDKRVFCYGILEAMTDDPIEVCRVCKAFVLNEEPPKESES